MDIQIKWGVRIPMRDGVKLSADVYLPKAEGRYPAIISRTPYLKTTDITIENSKFYASKGYAVIVVDTRGRGDSEGEFVPYRNEADAVTLIARGGGSLVASLYGEDQAFLARMVGA